MKVKLAFDVINRITTDAFVVRRVVSNGVPGSSRSPTSLKRNGSQQGDTIIAQQHQLLVGVNARELSRTLK